MMISCKKSTELICQSLDRPLTLWEKMQLRFHLLMCRGCKAFQKQSEALDRLIERRFHDLTDERMAEIEGLSSDACDRLKRRLREGGEGGASNAPSEPPE